MPDADEVSLPPHEGEGKDGGAFWAMRRVEDWGYLLRSIEARVIGTIDCMEGSAIA